MRYLRDSDYLYKITQSDLTTLIEEDETPELFLIQTETKAQEQILLFLRKRYDLNQLFQTYPDYKTGVTYTTGSTVWYSDQMDNSYSSHLYEPYTATTNLPNSKAWKRIEPRYQNIVDWMIVISLFKLHERLSPENIPKHRKDAYDEVMKFLESIQKGRLSPAFPEIENRIQNIYVGGEQSNGIGYNY
jgi:hypothetical protein